MKNIAEALSKAQAKITGAVADSANPFFKSKYADLSSVMTAIRIPFAENGLSYTQGCRLDGNSWVLSTTLLHSSGETLSFDYPVICAKQNDPQAFGAAVTYARRFSLSAIAGVSQVDDDGNTAAKTPAAPTVSEAPAKITEQQRKRLFAVCREAGWTENDLKAHVTTLGLESTKDLTVKAYDNVVEFVKKSPKPSNEEVKQ